MATHPPVMDTHPFVGVLATRTGLSILPFWLIQFPIPARPSTLTGLMYPPALAHSPVFVYIHPPVRGCPRTHTASLVLAYRSTHIGLSIKQALFLTKTNWCLVWMLWCTLITSTYLFQIQVVRFAWLSDVSQWRENYTHIKFNRWWVLSHKKCKLG